jgi:hypothetical protein
MTVRQKSYPLSPNAALKQFTPSHQPSPAALLNEISVARLPHPLT